MSLLHAVFEHVVQLFQLFVVLGVKVLAIFTGAMQHPTEGMLHK